MKTRGPRMAGIALAAVLALAACAHRAPYATEDFARDAGVRVEVANHNWMDLTIYAVSSGNRMRLGTVTTGSVQRYAVPRSLNIRSGDFRLEAHPVGSSEVHRSDPILVNPGGIVFWSLENQLGLSSLRVGSLR